MVSARALNPEDKDSRTGILNKAASVTMCSCNSWLSNKLTKLLRTARCSELLP